MDKLLYGGAYYDEYMPYERLDQDVDMMKKAGINVIRIAESTWSTEEPEEGVFDFSSVVKVLNKCEKEGMNVIIGTPTYAVPAWMIHMYPEIMVMNQEHRRPYGARQIMDITHPAYRFYCERVIRKLMEVCKNYSCIIGYQLDNETKHFGTSSSNVQAMFVRHMRHKYNNNLEQMNQDFGLNYWSNRINSWEEFPSMVGTINGSLGCEFEKFQRKLVTDFLAWQRSIVEEYRKEDQFVTHNFDFGWKGHSFGVQPDVNHLEAAKSLTIAGCDIYHPSQEHLTGREIGYCGDATRGLKKDNYLVIETEAQGFPEWTPYKGQLRLQAYSHLASGADAVMYWHWASLHNACETYWKGILSHDLQENAIYQEVSIIGNEFKKYSDTLIHLKKENKVAIMVSNEALTAIKWFPLPQGKDYNDVVRWIYDALYDMNVECDIIYPSEKRLDKYQIIFTPALYTASKTELQRLCDYAKNGGILIGTFKTAFTNDVIKVWPDTQPYLLSECFGIKYDEFTAPDHVYVIGDIIKESEEKEEQALTSFMELIEPQTAKVLAHYDHYMWKEYAAVTENKFGEGYGYYIGAMTTKEYLKSFLEYVLKKHNMWTWKQEATFPITIRSGENTKGEQITYIFNYSGQALRVKYEDDGELLFSGKKVDKNQVLEIEAWGIEIVKKVVK